jgi:acyl-CoA synthetase (AMP-forming)/AMP-acid ligase II
MLFPLEQVGAINDLALSRCWDAAALRAEVARRAARLSAHGVGRHSTVAIVHSGSMFFFADLFATWQVGATAACLDPALTIPELRNLLAFMRPAAMLTSSKPIIADATVPAWDLGVPMPVEENRGALGFELEDPALILFTSGTTGNPKGVVLSFQALLTRLRNNSRVIGADNLANSLVTLPLYFGHGLIGNALTPLMAGGTIVLPVRDQLAQNLGRIIDQHSISFLSSVPALWQVALRASRAPQGRSLLRVHVGSAPLYANLWQEIATWSRAQVWNCYGMTETANWFSGASHSNDGIEPGSVGSPWDGEAAVRNETGEISGEGEGEILLRSPSLMLGYLNRPDLTAGVHVDGWYKTGDRGSIDSNGQIRLVGRLKEEINRAGFKVQPAEVDQLLESHSAVAEACVFGITDHIAGEIVAVAIRLNQGATETSESLRLWCRKRMRREAVPERWFMVDEIPRTKMGKLSRQLVRRVLMGGADVD